MTRYATETAQSLRTVLATLDHTLTVFEQIATDFGREEHEEVMALQMRMQGLQMLTAKLQHQVQMAVFESSKQRCRRKPKPILRDRVAEHVIAWPAYAH